MNPGQWVQGSGIQSNDRSMGGVLGVKGTGIHSKDGFMGRVQWSGIQSMEGYRVEVQDIVHAHGSIL